MGANSFSFLSAHLRSLTAFASFMNGMLLIYNVGLFNLYVINQIEQYTDHSKCL